MAVSAWKERSGCFEFETDTLWLAVTDQTDRSCGWCWHVSAKCQYGLEVVKQAGDLRSADDAKLAAIAWVRTFCETTLAAISKAEAA